LLQHLFWPSVVALLSLRIALFIHATGEFRTLTDRFAHTGRCVRVHEEHHGFEDIAVFGDGALVSLASDHTHFAFRFGVSMRAALARPERDTNVAARILNAQSGDEWSPLTLDGAPSDFAPHGLAGWGEIGSKDASLLVVNHRTTHDSLEIFSMQGSSASHTKTLSHALLFNVNDCVFASAALVYCTNWRSYETGTVLDAIEIYGQRPWSNVVSCDVSLAAASCDVVATGIRMANGIETRGGYVFVVASLEPAIHVYARPPSGSPSGAALELVRKITTRSACDNLAWHGESSLLAACHPRALTFVRHSKSPRQYRAPCEVIRVHDALNASRTDGTVTVYMDSVGDEFSACSAAAVIEGKLWLGAVHQAGMLRCSAKDL